MSPLPPIAPISPFPDDAWNAWTPNDLAQRLGATSAHWYVVGGWALDLWHGTQTREHEDLEFSVLPEDVSHFRDMLAELVFFTVRDGVVEYLPASESPAADITQLWGGDLAERCWRVDMMVETRGTRDTWAYKRAPDLRRARIDVIRKTGDGVPYLCPAAVLLFKAKHRREKDERDFRLALPKLPPSEKDDLRQWLATLHPGHDWLQAL
ncbi:nucleotidyltransferase domain-containing protein [Pandoraea sp. PE-S2T-3]|uniref:nucleotidyltransferase domain-containing protein n=1 Tax=Pandoraea sp. PE-S2T-3 TaxID=1986993 RepID=UPI000B40208F|nr:amino acid transporter [Pandoraea sp. PE-S2T-3]